MTTTTRKQVRGGSGIYTDVATRGEETLSMSAQVFQAMGVTGMVVRFLARSEGGTLQPFKTFGMRQQRSYRMLDSEGNSTNQVTGIALNKVMIPLVTPYMDSQELDKFLTDNGAWNVIAEWVEEQFKSDGFEVIKDEYSLTDLIHHMIVPPTPPTKLLLAFPELKGLKDQTEADFLNAGKSSKSDSTWGEDESDDDDDKDDDDDSDSVN